MSSRPERVAVDLWLAPCSGATLAARISVPGHLPPAEVERWARLATPELQDAFLHSRRFLRAVLATYLDVAPEDVPLAADARGKPFVESGTTQFSLSHAGGWVAVAVAAGRAVGVDLESLSRVHDPLVVARRFFPAADHRLLAALPAERRDTAFTVSWTLKEALAKADGRGIGLMPGLVTGVEWRAPPAAKTSAIDRCIYAAANFDAPPGLIGAVAVAGEGITLNRIVSEGPLP